MANKHISILIPEVEWEQFAQELLELLERHRAHPLGRESLHDLSDMSELAVYRIPEAENLARD